MTATTQTTGTVADAAPILAWLADHPDLPAPYSVSLYRDGTFALSVALETRAQVEQWAAAFGREVRVAHHQGETQYSFVQFEPWFATACAIVTGIHDEATS